MLFRGSVVDSALGLPSTQLERALRGTLASVPGVLRLSNYGASLTASGYHRFADLCSRYFKGGSCALDPFFGLLQDEIEKAGCLPALLSLLEAGNPDERLGAVGCLAQLLPAAGGPGAMMVLEQVCPNYILVFSTSVLIPCVCCITVTTVCESLSDQPGLYMSVSMCLDTLQLPLILGMLGHVNEIATGRAAAVLCCIARQPELVYRLEAALPRLMTLLREPRPRGVAARQVVPPLRSIPASIRLS